MQVLITGGSGFLGRALARKLLGKVEVERVCIYSRGEYAQACMKQEIYDPEDELRFFIGDVRDKERLRRAMEGIDVVIHAAALKRIEVGYYNPTEMVKTNVMGTMNMIEAAQDAKVRKVVLVSSDKAFEPVSAYGHSKAMAETMVLAANHTRGKHGPIFSAVRYGNVSGSTGSVIPKWRQMILEAMDRGEDKVVVPVTDPDCTRFWMTIDQATDLIWTTIKTMTGGELNIPELPAYRLGDLAQAMGVMMDIKGLPDYEKRHEGMGPGNTSDVARRMSVEEIREGLQHV